MILSPVITLSLSNNIAQAIKKLFLTKNPGRSKNACDCHFLFQTGIPVKCSPGEQKGSQGEQKGSQGEQKGSLGEQKSSTGAQDGSTDDQLVEGITSYTATKQ